MTPVWKIFDLDGTLLDSNGIWAEVDAIFLARRGKAMTPDYQEFVAHAIYNTHLTTPSLPLSGMVPLVPLKRDSLLGAKLNPLPHNLIT